MVFGTQGVSTWMYEQNRWLDVQNIRWNNLKLTVDTKTLVLKEGFVLILYPDGRDVFLSSLSLPSFRVRPSLSNVMDVPGSQLLWSWASATFSILTCEILCAIHADAFTSTPFLSGSSLLFRSLSHLTRVGTGLPTSTDTTRKNKILSVYIG